MDCVVDEVVDRGGTRFVSSWMMISEVSETVLLSFPTIHATPPSPHFVMIYQMSIYNYSVFELRISTGEQPDFKVVVTVDAI